jgi:hypothetical protein
VNDPTAVEEAIELLDGLLKRNPRREAADEARRLLDHLMEKSGRDQTYTGLGPHKPFRFSKPPGHSRPLATPAGVPSQPDGQPIGRSAEELIGAPDSAVAAEAAKEARDESGIDGLAVSAESVKHNAFTTYEGAEEPASGRKAAAPAPPPLRTQEIVPDSADETLSEWGLRLAEVSETTAAMAAARSFAVILLPSRLLVVDKARTVLSEFWAVSREEAAERLRRCRGVLLDDAPSGRSVVLARRLRSMGLSVTVVPLLPDLVYSGGEDVIEFAFSDSACGTVTSSGRKSFGWDQVRLVNAARVGLPGAGAAYRLVLDLFVAQPQRLLRIWETTVNFARSGLGGKMGAAQSLQAVIEYLDARTPRALKTPSFRAMAKKSGPPLDFHSPAELDHYNRWFLYAGFGKYATSDL